MNKQRNVFSCVLIMTVAIVLSLQIHSFVRIHRETSGFSQKTADFLSSVCRLQISKAASELSRSWNACSNERAIQGEESHKTAKIDGAVEGDWLIWSLKSEPKTLTPLSVDRDIYSKWICIPNIFEPLMDYDFETMQLSPCLAESFKISQDGLVADVRLRGDIFFSDGEPVTSDDVIFTYNTLMNPMVDASNIAQSFRFVSEVIRLDKRSVRFVMEEKTFKALDVLSFWDVGILPEHIYRFDDPMDFNKRVSQPIGSGPYIFESWRVGDRVILRRNENYWGKKPYIKKIVYKFINNDRAALKALIGEDVDIIRPTEEQFAEYVNDEQFLSRFHAIAYWNPAVAFYSVIWNQHKEMFADRNVRLAMTHLINRQAIVDVLLRGNARQVTGPFYINSDAYDADIQPWPFDIGIAKELLNRAGWTDEDGDGLIEKNGQKFRFRFLYAASSAVYERIAKLMKDDFAQAGIEVIAEPMEWSILLGRVNERDFDSVIIGWGGDIVQDPYQLWHSSQIENRWSNMASFSNSAADEIIERANIELDADKRNSLLRELHGILHQEQPYTFLYTVPSLRFVDKRFKNITIYPLGLNYREWFVPNKQQRYVE